MSKDDYTEEEKARYFQRDEKGRMVKGSSLGRLSKGIPRGIRTLERERKKMLDDVTKRATQKAELMLNEKLEEILGTIYEQAVSGDSKALSLWMRHSMAPKQKSNRVDTDVLAEVANLPAEERLRYINRAMLEGEIDVTMGKELLQAQKAEMEATTLNRIQKLARRVAKEELSLEQLAHEFAVIADDLEPILIEGSTDGEG